MRAAYSIASKKTLDELQAITLDTDEIDFDEQIKALEEFDLAEGRWQETIDEGAAVPSIPTSAGYDKQLKKLVDGELASKVSTLAAELADKFDSNIDRKVRPVLPMMSEEDQRIHDMLKSVENPANKGFTNFILNQRFTLSTLWCTRSHSERRRRQMETDPRENAKRNCERRRMCGVVRSWLQSTPRLGALPDKLNEARVILLLKGKRPTNSNRSDLSIGSLIGKFESFIAARLRFLAFWEDRALINDRTAKLLGPDRHSRGESQG